MGWGCLCIVCARLCLCVKAICEHTPEREREREVKMKKKQQKEDDDRNAMTRQTQQI